VNEDLNLVISALRRAYPNGVPSRDYPPLLTLLSGDMSDGAIGVAIQELMGIEGVVVENDLARTLSLERPTESEVSRVEALLRSAGWAPVDYDEQR
jgi:Protein of unknown function (DUF3349)